MVKKNAGQGLLLKLVGLFLTPLAVFWILYRFGFWAILDAAAVSIVLGFMIWMFLRFLVRQRIFTFRRNKH